MNQLPDWLQNAYLNSQLVNRVIQDANFRKLHEIDVYRNLSEQLYNENKQLKDDLLASIRRGCN